MTRADLIARHPPLPLTPIRPLDGSLGGCYSSDRGLEMDEDDLRTLDELGSKKVEL
jgi:hypothetical protein